MKKKDSESQNKMKKKKGVKGGTERKEGKSWKDG